MFSEVSSDAAMVENWRRAGRRKKTAMVYGWRRIERGHRDGRHFRCAECGNRRLALAEKPASRGMPSAVHTAADERLG